MNKIKMLEVQIFGDKCSKFRWLESLDVFEYTMKYNIIY